MSQESNITPYSDNLSSPSSTPTPAAKSARFRKVANALKWSGLVGFWTQIVIGLFSFGGLALAIFSKSERTVPGVGFSLFCGVCSLICLVVGICISFRYFKMSKKFVMPNTPPPKKSITIKTVQIAIVVSLVGILIMSFGAATMTGIVLQKTLAFDPAKVFNNTSNTEFVNSLDVFIIQASIAIIFAHFIGLVSSLWIFIKIDK